MAVALAAVTAVTAGIDVVQGEAPVGAEAHHVLDVAGLLLLWVLARPRHRPHAGGSPAPATGGGVTHPVGAAAAARRTMRAAAVALVLLAGAVALAPAAGAHSSLVATEPPDGARLGAAPSEVVLRFDQGVSAGLGAVRVLDAGGGRVDGGAVTVDGTSLRVGVDDALDEGAYVVGWRAQSADGHPIRGAFSFTVGDAGPVGDGGLAAVLGEGDDRPWEVAGAVARALAYGGSLLAAGLGVFLLAAHDGGPEAPVLRRRLRQAAAVGAVGVVAVLPVQAALATGLGAGALLEDGVAREVLGDGVGWSSAVVLVGLVVLAVDAGRRAPAAAVGALLATAGFALTGHTTTSDPRWLATAGDVVHLVAGATWLGGLWGLVAVLRAAGPAATGRPPGWWWPARRASPPWPSAPWPSPGRRWPGPRWGPCPPSPAPPTAASSWPSSPSWVPWPPSAGGTAPASCRRWPAPPAGGRAPPGASSASSSGSKRRHWRWWS